MPSGRKRRGLALGIVLVILSAGLHAQVPGSRPDLPITFADLNGFIGDPRPSQNLLRDTLELDFFAISWDSYYPLKPYYFLLQDNLRGGDDIDEYYLVEANATHSVFQGMFWGPLFSNAFFLPLAALFDIILDTKWQISSIPAQIIAQDLGAFGQGKAFSFASLMRINVLFASDLYILDFKKFGGDFYQYQDSSLLGRSYAGLCFKFAEINSLFAGFNFLHIPHLAGYSDFLAANPEYAAQPRINVYDSKGDDFLYETRVKLVFQNNFLGAVFFQALLNIDRAEVLDMIGLGADFENMVKIPILRVLNPITLLLGRIDFSYLNILRTWTYSVGNEYRIGDFLRLHYAYDAKLKPFKILDSLEAGAAFNIRLSQKGDAISLRALGSVFERGGTYLFGGLGEAGYLFPGFGELKLGISYNNAESMKQLLFSENVPIFYLNFDLGMSDGKQHLADLLREVVK